MAGNQRRLRHTKAQYAALYDNPGALFDGVQVTLYPNGSREIWIQGQGGKGFRITASEGRAGLGIRINRVIGAPPITINGNEAKDSEVLQNVPDVTEVTLTQYNSDVRSQAYRRAYQAHNLNTCIGCGVKPGEPHFQGCAEFARQMADLPEADRAADRLPIIHQGVSNG